MRALHLTPMSSGGIECRADVDGRRRCVYAMPRYQQTYSARKDERDV